MARPSPWSLVLKSWICTATLLLCLIAVGGTIDISPWKVAQSVQIYNELPGVLVVNCDCHKCHQLSVPLQQKILPPQSVYYFDFKMSLLGDSYVWCKMVYGGLWNGFKVWSGPGFWGQRRMPCQQCSIEVKTDGFYQGKAENPASVVWVKPWMHVPPSMD